MIVVLHMLIMWHIVYGNGCYKQDAELAVEWVRHLKWMLRSPPCRPSAWPPSLLYACYKQDAELAVEQPPLSPFSLAALLIICVLQAGR